jgi:hypothetical protein
MELGSFITLIVFGVILLIILGFSFYIIVSEEYKKKTKNIPAKALLILLSTYVLISLGFIFKFGLHHVKL